MYVAPFAAPRGLPREKPNIVWILSEDNSKHYLKLYDEAAEFLALTSEFDPAPAFKEMLSTCASHVESLILLSSVVFLRDAEPNISFQMPRSEVRAQDGEISRRLDYLGW
jgi:hypothetical protein